MANESATQYGKCPHCGQEVVIDQRWTAGGVNDYGGYVLQCDGCAKTYRYHLGRDIADSRVMSGAKIVDTYDREVGNEAEVMKRHGLTGAAIV